MSKKIWVIEAGVYSDRHVVNVFDGTEEEAKMYAEKLRQVDDWDDFYSALAYDLVDATALDSFFVEFSRVGVFCEGDVEYESNIMTKSIETKPQQNVQQKTAGDVTTLLIVGDTEEWVNKVFSDRSAIIRDAQNNGDPLV